MKERRVEFVVSFPLPAGATVDRARCYVEDAIASWRGSLPPLDPMFELDGDQVRAKRLVKARKKK